MLDELLVEIDKLDMELNDFIRLVSFNQDDDLLSLTFELVFRDVDKTVKTAWEVFCHDPQQFNVNGYNYYDFEILESHILLWQQNDPWYELYFNGKPVDAKALIGDLYLTHKQITDNLLQFGEHLNNNVSLDLLFNVGYGLLARGPEKLIRAYSTILEDYKLSVSLLLREGLKSKKWLNNQWVVDERTYSILLFGNSYVVAPDFTCKKVI